MNRCLFAPFSLKIMTFRFLNPKKKFETYKRPPSSIPFTRNSQAFLHTCTHKSFYCVPPFVSKKSKTHILFAGSSSLLVLQLRTHFLVVLSWIANTVSTYIRDNIILRRKNPILISTYFVIFRLFYFLFSNYTTQTTALTIMRQVY